MTENQRECDPRPSLVNSKDGVYLQLQMWTQERGNWTAKRKRKSRPAHICQHKSMVDLYWTLKPEEYGEAEKKVVVSVHYNILNVILHVYDIFVALGSGLCH